MLFKPCASQRLFLPQILRNLDRLIYVDADVIFLKPIQLLWAHFKKFNSTQLAALTPEHEDEAMGWLVLKRIWEKTLPLTLFVNEKTFSLKCQSAFLIYNKRRPTVMFIFTQAACYECANET